MALEVISADVAEDDISPYVMSLTFLPVPCMNMTLLSYGMALEPVCAGCVLSLLIVKLKGVMVKSCSEP